VGEPPVKAASPGQPAPCLYFTPKVDVTAAADIAHASWQAAVRELRRGRSACFHSLSRSFHRQHLAESQRAMGATHIAILRTDCRS
jgi:hypothetical protein